MLRDGCDRLNAQSASRDGRPTAQAFQEDLAGMLELPGVPFDAVRWGKAKSDKRGYVRVDGNLYCAGPAWHDREPAAGVRAGTVEILADRARHVATLRRSFGEGESVRNPASLMPAPIARPRAFGESAIREDMPDALVDAIDRLDGAGRRKALRALGRAAVFSQAPLAVWDCGGNLGPKRDGKEAACSAPDNEDSQSRPSSDSIIAMQTRLRSWGTRRGIRSGPGTRTIWSMGRPDPRSGSGSPGSPWRWGRLPWAAAPRTERASPGPCAGWAVPPAGRQWATMAGTPKRKASP